MSWEGWLQNFENWRLREIKSAIQDNSKKNQKANFLGTVIWLNSLSPLKISETFSYFTKGYYLNAEDFLIFYRTLK